MVFKHFSLYICIQSELKKSLKRFWCIFSVSASNVNRESHRRQILRYLCMNFFDDFLLKTRTNYAKLKIVAKLESQDLGALIRTLLCVCFSIWHWDLTGSALISGCRGFGSSRCVMFLGRKRYSYSARCKNEWFASHPGGKGGKGGGGGRNTPSYCHLGLQKPGWARMRAFFLLHEI